jgi:alkylation response protein AidB-like acyl-CoA dehydrogenase
MDLSFTPDQDALREACQRLYAKESHGERVREVEATGFDPHLWEAVVAMGLPTMALPEADGGAGASLTDLAAAVEVHGAHLGSVPLVETAVVARLLARIPGDAAAAALAAIVDGAPATLALRPEVDGVARLVPQAAAASVVVAMDRGRLVLVTDPAAEARPALSGLAVADVDLSGATVLLRGEDLDPDAISAHQTAYREWVALTAVAQAGLARATFDVGLQYAKDRHQFGVPIGTFQSLQHRFADLHARVDGGRLLAYEAIWALDEDEPTAEQLVAQAGWYCGQVAEEAAGFSLHVHGGYGFMLEYDVQLHVRRAKAARLVLGEPRELLHWIALARWSDSLDNPTAAEIEAARTARPTRPGMDFRFDPETEAFRAEVRTFIAEHLTRDVIERALTSGTMHDWGFHKALCERGYLAAGWPKEVGGLGRTAIDTTLLNQELFGAGAPIDGQSIAAMVGATLMLQGTDEQRRDIVPRILAGEVMCCLGYSEPDAGSDVAAVATRAVRDGDDWVIDGQKMFTTMAHEAHYVFLLCRSNLDVPKHKGLTMFLVPMDTPGIEITPVHTMGGERTNITFYNEVRVPDSCRVGEVDDGWDVMHAALVYERNSANWGEPNHLVESMARWAKEVDRFGERAVQEVLARWSTELEVGRLLLFRSAWLSAQGGLPHVEGSMAKLHITEAFVRASSELLDLLGPDGLVPMGQPSTVLDGLVEHAFRHAVVTTIYGGSSEVQREIIAGRGLGLPRNR